MEPRLNGMELLPTLGALALFDFQGAVARVDRLYGVSPIASLHHNTSKIPQTLSH